MRLSFKAQAEINNHSHYIIGENRFCCTRPECKIPDAGEVKLYIWLKFK